MASRAAVKRGPRANTGRIKANSPACDRLDTGSVSQGDGKV